MNPQKKEKLAALKGDSKEATKALQVLHVMLERFLFRLPTACLSFLMPFNSCSCQLFHLRSHRQLLLAI
jgi:hypothetical protein